MGLNSIAVSSARTHSFLSLRVLGASSLSSESANPTVAVLSAINVPRRGKRCPNASLTVFTECSRRGNSSLVYHWQREERESWFPLPAVKPPARRHYDARLSLIPRTSTIKYSRIRNNKQTIRLSRAKRVNFLAPPLPHPVSVR